MDQGIKIMMEVVINKKDLQNLLITAFEAGSYYWAETSMHWKDVLAGETIIINDVETGEELGKVNLESIKKALQMMADGKSKGGREIPKRHWQNLVGDNSDAETADVFFQLATMGEIVYG